MSTFTIPTVFKAVDNLSGPLQRMGNNMDKFEKSAKGVFGNLSELQKELFSFAAKAAVIAGVSDMFRFGVQSIMDYETSLASLEAVTGQSASLFKGQIESIATASRKNAIDVAKSFEVVGSAMSEYLDNPEALGKITDAGITLSKASRMELEPALRTLTSVMNQFGYSADQANNVINRLTAGEIVGNISTEKTGEYLQQFGAVASANNVSLTESVALVQALGKKIPVETLGRASRNMITFMAAVKGNATKSKAATDHQVNLDIISNSAISLGDRLKELSKIQGDAAAMSHFFGEENIAAGTTIFQNLAIYDEFVKKIAKTNEAQKQAAVNSNTLSNAMQEVKNSFVNAVVSGDKLSPSLELLKSIAFALAKNMDVVMSAVMSVIGAFVLWKTVTLTYNTILSVQTALTNFYTRALIQQRLATGSVSLATAALAVVQAELNALYLANPIGVVVVGVLALAAASYGLYKILSKGTAQEQAALSLKQKVLENTIEQRTEAMVLFQTLKKAEEGSKLYNDTLAKLEQLQPGIIEKYNLQVKSIKAIEAAEKDLIGTIMKRAELQASQEITKESARELLDAKTNAKQYESGFKKYLFISKYFANKDLQEKQAIFEASVAQEAALNREAETKNTMNGNIDLTVNDPNNRTKVEASPGINVKQPQTSSTIGDN